MRPKEMEKMTGRQILDTIANVGNHEQKYDAIAKRARGKIGKKFHHCSTESLEYPAPCDLDHYHSELSAKLRKLRDNKLPYRLVTKIEWFRPAEESNDI